MPEGVNYRVNAILRTEGAFQREMFRSARAADALGSSWSRMSNALVTGGERVRGTFGTVALQMAKGAAFAGAAGLAGGIGYAAREGVRFNNMMEQGALGLGTMYTTFGLAAKSAAVMSGEMSEFQKSLELAGAMQQELFDIAKASPATYEDIATAYSSMAPGLSAATKSLTRQRDLVEKIAVLGFTTGGDFKQLGADVGRIVQGVAGADVAVFRTLAPTIKKAFTEITGKEVAGDFAQQFNKVARVDPEKALQIFEKSVEAVGGEINEAFGQSFEGITATVSSSLQVLAGDFGKPLMESVKSAFKRFTGEGGILAESGRMPQLRAAFSFAGQQLAAVADRLFSALERGAIFVADNWVMIATKIQQAGVLAGVAIKAAIVTGVARLVAGAAMIAAGKGIGAARAIGGGMKRAAPMAGAQGVRNARALIATRKAFGIMAREAKYLPSFVRTGLMLTALSFQTAIKKAKTLPAIMKAGFAATKKAFFQMAVMAHRGVSARGLVAGAGGLMRRAGSALTGRGMQTGILKIATLATVLTAAGAAAAVLALAFSGVIVIVGGMAAYVISKWDTIKTELIQGFKDGTISLVPLITSLYTFWERLKLVGEALLGGTNSATMMQGGIDFLATAVDFASGAISIAVKGLSIMVGVIGALKLGISKFFQLVAWGLEKMSKIPKMGHLADVAEDMRSSQQSWMDSADDSFRKADKFANAADAIAEAKLDPMAYEAAKKKAKDLEQSLMDMLSGKGGKRASRPAVNVGKVEVVVNTTDPDPDRLFGVFIPKMVAMADKRVQPYDALEQGT